MKPKIAISQTTIANTRAVTPLTRLSHDVEYVPNTNSDVTSAAAVIMMLAGNSGITIRSDQELLSA